MISALSSGNVTKYEFLTGKDILPEKRFPRKIYSNKNISIFSVRQRIEKAN